MKTANSPLDPRENPFDVLGLPEDATDADIRSAYLSKVKEHPPDRAPAEFERIRDAYEILRDPRSRAHLMLLSVDPEAPLSALLDGQEAVRRFVGPGPWIEVLKEQ